MVIDGFGETACSLSRWTTIAKTAQRAKELREMFQYFEAHTYFGPDARTAIAAANALVPGGFTAFSEWARRNMKPGG